MRKVLPNEIYITWYQKDWNIVYLTHHYRKVDQILAAYEPIRIPPCKSLMQTPKSRCFETQSPISHTLPITSCTLHRVVQDYISNFFLLLGLIWWRRVYWNSLVLFLSISSKEHFQREKLGLLWRSTICYFVESLFGGLDNVLLLELAAR